VQLYDPGVEAVLARPLCFSANPILVVGSKKELELMTIKQSLCRHIDVPHHSTGISYSAIQLLNRLSLLDQWGKSIR
jgi:hypothetical protein